MVYSINNSMVYYILIFFYCCHIAWEQGIEDGFIGFIALSCVFWFIRQLYVHDKEQHGGTFWQ
jgi:hypothetical protein